MLTYSKTGFQNPKILFLSSAFIRSEHPDWFRLFIFKKVVLRNVNLIIDDF